MDKFRCTRCSGNLTMDEYRRNVCLCDWCCVRLLQVENTPNIYWSEVRFNNVDEILERLIRKKIYK